MRIEALVLSGAAIVSGLSLREPSLVRRDNKVAQKVPHVEGFSDDLNNKLSSGFTNALKNIVDVTYGYSGPNEIDGIPLVYATNAGQQKSRHRLGLDAFANTSLYRNGPSKEDVESGKVTKVEVTQDDINILNAGSISNLPVYYREIPVGNSSKHLKPILGEQLESPNTGCCSLSSEQKNEQSSLTKKEKAKHPEIAQKDAKIASSIGDGKNNKRQEYSLGLLLGDVTLYTSSLTSPFVDAFYHPIQSLLGIVGPGFPIAYRLIGVDLFAVPAGTRAYQVQYRSENTAGNRAIGNVATIYIPPTNPDPGLIIGHATHENALNLGCATSYFWALGRDTQSITDWMNRGWVFVSPDIEGFNNAFLASVLGGKLLLDALRATKNLAPLIAISTPNRVALFGYSAGSTVAGIAGRIIPSYAPEFAPGGSIPVIAIAMGGVIVNLENTLRYINRSMWTAFVIMGIIGIGTEYPFVTDVATNDFNGDWGAFRYYTSYIGCAEQQVVNFYMQDFSEVFNNLEGLLNSDGVPGVLQDNGINSPMIDVPVYIDQSSGDEVANVADVDNLVSQWCSAGRRITYYRNPNSLAHLAQEPGSQTSSMNFFSQVANNRFTQGACGVPLANPL